MTEPGDYVDRLRCGGCGGIYPEHRFRWVQAVVSDEDVVLDLRDPPPADAPPARGGLQRTLIRAWHGRHRRR